MKTTLLITLILTNILCFSQGSVHPEGFTILEQKTGDLDKDGIDEKVIIYNTPDSTDFGIHREIQILKLVEGKWTVWKKSRSAVLKSGEGGMMGDPYSGIDIIKGILLIHHNGGSSWKWGYVDKYRFQNNEFQLIGHTSSFGKPCEYWGTFDFNLSIGKIIYKKEYENCENADQDISKTEKETFYRKDIKLNLTNRHNNDIKVVSPVNGFEMYL